MSQPEAVEPVEPRRDAPTLVCGARTAMRPLHASDAQSLSWLLDPAVRRYMPDAPQTQERLTQYAAWVERQSSVTRHLSVIVTIGSQTIGIIQGRALEPTGKTIEWGFALARGRWGEGLMQESGRAFLLYAVEQLGVERIEARTALDNRRAIATLQRLGARCEGVIVGGLADKTTDCYLWSILAADVRWQGTPPPPVGQRSRAARRRRSRATAVVLAWPTGRHLHARSVLHVLRRVARRNHRRLAIAAVTPFPALRLAEASPTRGGRLHAGPAAAAARL